MDNKRKLFLFLTGIAAVLLLILIVSFWPSREAGKPSKEVTQMFEDEKVPPEEQKEIVGQMGEKVLRMERKKLIENIKLDKQKVCPGEALKVTMNQNPDEVAPVMYTTNRNKGNPSIIRFVAPGTRDIFVSAGDGRFGVDMKRVNVEVLDKDSPECAGKPIVVLTAGLSRTEPETADFEVKQAAGLSTKGKVRYAWDFGDGKREDNDLRYVSHNYGLRDQEKPESTFLVTVTVTDESGKSASTQANISIPNVHFIATISGNPVIPAIYNRFPNKAGSAFETDVTFKNIHPNAVEFEKAIVKLEFCREGKETKTLDVPASRILSGTSLGARQSVTRKLSISSDVTGGEACRVEIAITGEMIPRGENPVTSTIFLELGVPPTKDKGGNAGGAVEVRDAKLVEKLEKAQKILGPGKPVTPEDVRRLEKQGRL